MNDIAQAIEEVRSEIAAAAGEFLPDLFTLLVPSSGTPDGFGGTTDSGPTEYKNIPGQVEPLSRSDQTIGGAQITTQTHKIKMPVTTITRRIKPSVQLIRQAQGSQEAETYENPVVLLGSMDAFMTVAAALK